MQYAKYLWPIINSLGLLLLVFVIGEPFELNFLFYDTILTGGDAGSWYQIANHLKESLIPNGRLFGWDQGNFFGYANLQHYFVLPFFIIVLLSYVTPLTVALKVITVSGFFLMPFVVYWSLRKMEYKNPVPLSGAWIVLAFMFSERYSMFGGNMLSTLAGEFCYSIAFTLMVAYLAMLLSDIKQQKLSFRTGILLGLIGLSHAFVFFVAVLMPIYFLLSKPSRQTVKILFLNYLVGFLVMAFWVLPMLSNLNFTTPIAMVWRFPDIFEFLYYVHYEILFAGLAVLCTFFFKKMRTLEGGFFAFGILCSFMLYLLASALHVPDIRFFPPLLFFSLLVIINAVAQLIGFHKYYHGLASFCILGLSIIFGASWVFAENSAAPAWFSGNYSGYELKPAFVDGRAEKLFSSLKGSYDDPRVAWEQGEYDQDFGTARVFENIPLFTGRASTEGIHYASGLLSLPITILNGEFSYTPSSPSANIYSHYFVDSLPERFRMLNIREFIAFSPQITQLIKESGEFKVIKEIPPYTLFSWKNHDTQYVTSPFFQPQITENFTDWKRRFNNWFRRGENLDLTIVNGAFVSNDLRDKYFSGRELKLEPTGILAEIARKPIEPAVIDKVKMRDFQISFETDKPGTPHIIKVSYSPNWQSPNSEPIFMVAPGFMMIYPKTKQVSLVYTRHWSEYVGIALSALCAVFVLYFTASKGALRQLSSSSYLEFLVSIILFSRKTLLIIFLIILLLGSIWSYQKKQEVYSDYIAGMQAVNIGQLENALSYLKVNASMEKINDVDNVDVPMSIYALARAYRDLDKIDLAKLEFEKLIKYYPRWSYIDEIYSNLGAIAISEKRFIDAKQLLERCLVISKYGRIFENCQKDIERVNRFVDELSSGKT